MYVLISKYCLYLQNCRFTKCDMCVLLKYEMSKPQCADQEKKALNELLNDHIRLQELVIVVF